MNPAIPIRIFFIKSKESVPCPICSGRLAGYDHKNRGVIFSDGLKRIYRLKRLKCGQCGKIHIELPDKILPFKHYAAEVVEAEVDGIVTHCGVELSTINGWRRQFQGNLIWLEGALRSIWSVSLGKPYPLLSPDSLLQLIRNKGSGWLTIVTQFLINAGFRLPTRFAFCS